MSGKERLKELESKEEYVFHGSDTRLDKLEPRQAYNYPGIGPNNRVPDEDSAVWASPNSDLAIFMAIYCKPNVENCRTSFTNYADGRVTFRATPQSAGQVHGAKGYVHVFPKEDFPNSRGGSEVWTNESVKPIEIVEITEKDLPPNIEVKDF